MPHQFKSFLISDTYKFNPDLVCLFFWQILKLNFILIFQFDYTWREWWYLCSINSDTSIDENMLCAYLRIGTINNWHNKSSREKETFWMKSGRNNFAMSQVNSVFVLGLITTTTINTRFISQERTQWFFVKFFSTFFDLSVI